MIETDSSQSVAIDSRSGAWLIYGVIVLLFFCIFYLVWAGQKITLSQLPATEIQLDGAYGFEPVQAVGHKNDSIVFSHTGVHISRFSLALPNASGYDKLKLYFSSKQRSKLFNTGHIQVLFKRSNANGEQVIADHFTAVVKPLMVYEIPLIKQAFDSISVLLRTNKETVEVELYKLELLPDELTDSLFFEWVVATLLVLLLLLPGILIVGAITSSAVSNTIQLSSFYIGSILYYTLLFVFIKAGFWFGLDDTGTLTTVLLLGSLIFLFVFNYKRGKFQTTRSFLMMHKLPLAFFCLVFYSLTFYISQGTDYSFVNTTWKSISGPKTFYTFGAHDNYFQFANGRVMEENLPFSVEYGDKSKGQRILFFYPEDRTILGGAIYSVFRDVLKMAYIRVGNSYFTYTIIGLAMNLFILFPLFCLANRYLKSWRLWLCMLLVCVNGVFIVQSALTWYKLCGGGLFITALYLLLKDRKNISHWLLGGVALGLAANMHAGAALGIPLYFILAVWLQLKDSRFGSFRWLAGPVTLVGAFALVNLPWKIIKAKYFSNSIGLIASHFFAGYHVENDLLKSAQLFFEKVPLSTQIPFRLNTTWAFFRIEEVLELWRRFSNSTLSDALFYWTHLEVAFSVFLYYPVILLLVATCVLRLVKKPSTQVDAYLGSALAHRNELLVLGLVGLLTQFAYMMVKYSGFAPDLVWSQPLGVSFVVYFSMLALLLRQGKIISLVLAFYLLFTSYRFTIAYINL